MKICLIYFLILFIYLPAKAGELSIGNSKASKSNIENGYQPADGNCPSVIKKWVDNDFSDTYSWGVIKFKSEANTCQTSIKSYQDYFSKKQRSVHFSEPLALGNYLSNKYKNQIHTSYQSKFLKDCNTLPTEKSSAIQTRFYAASARIAGVNSMFLDELSYYDSVLPSNGAVLQDIECAPMFPENNKKCVDYKIQARNCDKNKKQRWEAALIKTKENLTIIKELKQANQFCVHKIISLPGAKIGRSYSKEALGKIEKSCKPFLDVISLKTMETPWVNGEVFNKLVKKSGIEKAVQQQMAFTRKALADKYKQNIENFRCLSSSVKNNGNSCDFNEIRTDLAALPDLNFEASDFVYKNPKDAEAKTYLDAESCLLSRGEDRENTRKTINGAGRDALIGGVTLGVGVAATAAIKAGGMASKMARSMIVTNGIAGAGASAYSLNQTYDSCTRESKILSDLSTKQNLTQENICANSESPLAEAREEESDCLVSAILSGTSVLPFLGSVPGLTHLIKKQSGNIARSLNSAQRVPLEVLSKNSTDLQRAINAGQIGNAKKMISDDMKALGYNLDDTQVAAILRAHTDEAAACIIGKCSPAQLAKKVEIMKNSGVEAGTRRTAIERGWAGQPETNPVPLTQKQIAEKYTDTAFRYVEGANTNIDKATAMINEFKIAGRAERTAKPLSYATSGNEKVTINQFDLLHKDLSSSQTVIARVRGGDFEVLAEDISNVSEHISKLKPSSMGSVAGKKYEDLIGREVAAMAREAQHSLNLSKNKEYAVGKFEAWQFMRARVELVRHNIEKNKMSEKYFDQVNEELDIFVKTNKMEKQVNMWKKAGFSP